MLARRPLFWIVVLGLFLLVAVRWPITDEQRCAGITRGMSPALVEGVIGRPADVLESGVTAEVARPGQPYTLRVWGRIVPTRNGGRRCQGIVVWFDSDDKVSAALFIPFNEPETVKHSLAYRSALQ
jgi:hypothetical protein